MPQSDKEAAVWFRKTADQGDANAQFNLDVMYNQGQGVPQCFKGAAVWLRNAADQGNANNKQDNLGTLYAQGQGLPHRPKEAVL